jgi:tetratricopeptide (TPR) repeat protein
MESPVMPLFRLRACIALTTAMACQPAIAGAEASEDADPADFARQTEEFEQRIAKLAAIDPLQPETLDARLDYARMLHEASVEKCLPLLDTAESQLTLVLSADPDALLAWPDGPGDAMSLLQTIQNTRGQCADDAGEARAAFESSIATGERAIALLRDNWDFEEMAIAQFNVAFARRELGDLDGALRDLEQVLIWDQEFGFRDQLESDYATLLRWHAGGEEPDPADVARFVSAFNQTKARFEFSWKPHRARWSTEVDRANLRNGVFGEVSTRYQSQVDVHRERDDWVLVTTIDGTPTVDAAGSTGATAEAERWQGMIAGLTAALPEMVVGTDGSFRELRNLEQHRAILLKEVKRFIAESKPPDGPGQPEETIDEFLGAALNAELLTTMAAGQWDIAVGAWIGGEFDHGDWYSLTFEEALPGFSDRPVSKTMTFKVSRWLPCAVGSAPKCVEVLVRIVPDPEGITRAVSEFVTRVMPAASRAETDNALRAVSYEFDLRYRLVTEPDTLRPWSIEERKYVYASSLEDGKRAVMARRDRTVETAQYAN